MRSPRVVGTHAPGVAFGIADGKLAAAVGGILQRADDGGSGGYSAGVSGVGVGDNDVGAAGFHAAEFVGGFEAAAVLVVLGGAEHDHAAVERKFGVSDGSVFAFVNRMALKAEDLAEPVNGG